MGEVEERVIYCPDSSSFDGMKPIHDHLYNVIKYLDHKTKKQITYELYLIAKKAYNEKVKWIWNYKSEDLIVEKFFDAAVANGNYNKVLTIERDRIILSDYHCVFCMEGLTTKATNPDVPLDDAIIEKLFKIEQARQETNELYHSLVNFLQEQEGELTIYDTYEWADLEERLQNEYQLYPTDRTIFKECMSESHFLYKDKQIGLFFYKYHIDFVVTKFGNAKYIYSESHNIKDKVVLVGFNDQFSFIISPFNV